MGTPLVSPAVRAPRAGSRLLTPGTDAHRSAGVVAVVAVLAAVGMLAGGCGAAGVEPSPLPSPSGSPAESATTPATTSPIRPEGAGLRAFGIVNGPAEFSLPRSSVAASIVDQPNNVVLVLTAPPPSEVSRYLRATLPGSGFAVADDTPSDDTFRFAGLGWAGSFTTAEGSCAVLLRPR